MSRHLPKPRSLGRRIVLQRSACLAALLGTLAVGVYFLGVGKIRRDLDEELQEQSSVLRSMLQLRSGDHAGLQALADVNFQEEFVEAGWYYQLLDEHGRVLAASRQASLKEIPITAAVGRAAETRSSQWETVDGGDGWRVRVLDTPVMNGAQHLGVLQVGTSLADADNNCRRLAALLAILVPLLIVLDGAAAWYLTSRALDPLQHIASAAARISTSDLTHRIPLSGNGDELEQLSCSVNGLMARLQISSARQEELLPNLLHELRQPLTILRAESEHALRSNSLAVDCRKLLAGQVKQLEHVSNTLSDLMTMARAESGSLPVRRNREDLAELMQAAADGMQERAQASGIILDCKVQPGVIAEVDTGQIWRLLLNLLDNAIKYNRPGGRIDVLLSGQDRDAAITISDNGRGIASADLPHIFERSYRSAEARQSGLHGLGLGLSFVRWIAEAHGGKIEVISTVGEGSCFRVLLPRVASISAADCGAPSYAGVLEPAYASAGNENS